MRHIAVQDRGRTTSSKGGQDVDQYPFVGGQMGDDVLDGPDPTCSWGFPRGFGEAIDGLENRLLSIFQNIDCIHWMFLSSSLHSAGRDDVLRVITRGG